MPSSSNASKKSNPQRPKRRKASLACQRCRAQKRKCDGARPACGNCQKKEFLERSCKYSRIGTQPGRGEFSQATKSPTTSSTVTGDITAKNGIESALLANEINSVVNSRLGLDDGPQGPSYFPLVNAPIFGSLNGLPIINNLSLHATTSLPSRRQADELVDLYLELIQPTDPVIDEKQFRRLYKALFAGHLHGTEEQIFTSTLNIVFALATHLQVSIDFQQRQQIGNTYFHHAWALLQPEALLWEPSSVEAVECLLLMSRFLQCTNNVGCAVRMAQSLGLHIIHVASSSADSPETKKRKHVWQACVMIDRQISMLLGRIPVVAPNVSLLKLDTPGSEDEFAREYWTKTMDLLELRSQVGISQMSIADGWTQKHNSYHVSVKDDQLDAILQLSGVLRRWESSLSPRFHWHGVQHDPAIANSTAYKQSMVLYVRLHHARIFMFRHVLWHYCLSHVSDNSNQTIEDGMVRSCAALSVESARNIIAVIYENEQWDPHSPNKTIPWWTKFFYIYIASTILTAAMLRTDLYTPEVSLAWDQAMSFLATYESLSPYIQQSRAAFLALNRKILTFNAGGTHICPFQTMALPSQAPDPFQVELNNGSDLFDMDNLNWLINVDIPGL
ncbi:hypothetical protein F5Y18DRAFT_427453 [Xylariaceae sp. FL1019]|nr:hypothetical protein F5Y18DRAFT_427453 [Xylariaceae sp. FL1019]